MSVSQAPVTFDFTQPGDVLLVLTTKWTFHGVVPFQQCGEPSQFILDQVPGLRLRIDTCLLAEIP